jgi:hypothetical protein
MTPKPSLEVALSGKLAGPRRAIVVLTALLTMAMAANAASPDPKPAKGFWKVLVKPHAKWELHETPPGSGGADCKIVVETYDVRKVGGADVARLQWRLFCDKKVLDYLPDDHLMKQVAVTDAGLYLLSRDASDSVIADALKGKPSRSDPPKPYKGSRINEGRYLDVRELEGGVVACMGEGPMPGAAQCDDICYGEMCVSASAGIVNVIGTWAPGLGTYVQKGFKVR